MSLSKHLNYAIHGNDMQFVEFSLETDQRVLAEAGAMMYMNQCIQMETILGDGTEKKENKGFMNTLMNAGKRMLTGEGLFMTLFSNEQQGQGRVAFASPYPGKIIPIDLRDYGGALICQKDAFLCASQGISIGIHLQKKLGVGFFGGEGFIMQKLEGNELAFLHAGGTIVQKEIDHGETLRLDTGCLVAMSSDVNYDIEMVGDIKSGIFGGEGLFLATLKGPGTVWLQSLPFSRMADRIYAASGKPSKGETKGLNNPLEELSGLTNLFGRD